MRIGPLKGVQIAQIKSINSPNCRIMIMEDFLRVSILIFEQILRVCVFVYYAILYAEIITKTNYICMPIFLYILTISLYYYICLLKKSPGSLFDFSGLEVREMCEKCKRLKSNRTFHCDSCNKCYYKRDHHCPWVGKCIAAGNYKEFYFFVMFLTLYHMVSLLKSACYIEISFFNDMILVFCVLFFGWINFLLCQDKTSLEYHKSNENTFFKYNAIHKVDFYNWKEKVRSKLLDGNLNNLLYVFCPFLIFTAKIKSDESL